MIGLPCPLSLQHVQSLSWKFLLQEQAPSPSHHGEPSQWLDYEEDLSEDAKSCLW